MSIRTRLVVFLALALLLTVMLWRSGVELGITRDLVDVIVRGGLPVRNAAEAADVALVVNRTVFGLVAGTAAIVIWLTTLEARRCALVTRHAGRFYLFLCITIVFGAVTYLSTAIMYLWAWKLVNPRASGLPSLESIPLADATGALLWFMVLRLPLWNLTTSAAEARELAARGRRQLGEWIIGKGVIEREKADLKRDVEGYWKREMEDRARREREDYARRNPPCPNPAAHRAPPPTSPSELTRKIKKRDLNT